MTTNLGLSISDFDHLEFAVADLERTAEIFLRLGFEKVATREILARRLRSYLLVQNKAYIVLSHSDLQTDPVSQFVEKHGDGVIDIALCCDDVLAALEAAVQRGAEIVHEPKSFQKSFGQVQQASIKALGQITHTLIARQGALFAEGFEDPFTTNNVGIGLERVDHVTVNSDIAEASKWCTYYRRIFGFSNPITPPSPNQTLHTEVFENSQIKISIVKPCSTASETQRFIDVMHGSGVEHVGFLTNNIVATAHLLQNQETRFLDAPPPAYYKRLTTRIPNVTENTNELAQLAILVDGDSSGYLLQTFTKNIVGPFFCELIQRKGATGLGEGNAQAIEEAIKEERTERGIITEQ